MEPAFDPYPYCQAAADLILARVTEGATLAEACDHDPLPSRAVVLKWLAENPEFEARYRRAREIAMEAMADDLMTWSRQDLGRDLALLSEPPTLAQITQAYRTRIAVRQWLMSHWAPKTYGARTAPRDSRAEASTTAPSPAPSLDAPHHISPRPFTITPIADGKPITIPSLQLPESFGTPEIAAQAPVEIVEPPAARSRASSPRPSRRARRIMTALARKRPPAPDCNPPPI